MDEIDFGPGREFRLPARYRRVLAAVAAAGIAAAGIVTAAAVVLTTHQGAGAGQAASPSSQAGRAPALTVCPPVHPAMPSLGGLPAGMRPGALRVVAAAQFSGECHG